MRCSAKDKSAKQPDGLCDGVAKFWAPLVYSGEEQVWMALCSLHAHFAVGLGGRVRPMKWVEREKDS